MRPSNLDALTALLDTLLSRDVPDAARFARYLVNHGVLHADSLTDADVVLLRAGIDADPSSEHVRRLVRQCARG